MAVGSSRGAALRALSRWAGPEGSLLLASRPFSSASVLRHEAGEGGGDALQGGAAAAAAWPDGGGGDALAAAGGAADSLTDGVAAAAAAAAAGTSDIGSILGATCAAVDGLHAATGLPWWATIVSVGVLVRAAMFPVSLQGMRASAALQPLLRQARDDVVASMQLPPAAPLPPPAAEEGKRRDGGRQQKWQRAAQQAAPTSSPAGGEDAAQQQEEQQEQQQQQQQQPPPRVQVSNAAIIGRFQQLRRAAGAPHPAWVLAAPLAQLPVFITAMATVRTMSLRGWPGFEEGGAAWFPDLTAPAMDLANLVAPLGTAGVVLPLGIAVSMFANIDAAFTVPAGSRQQSSTMLWVTSSLRLLMEWMIVPLFAIALQLPQGALCYWATSSSLALLQSYALRVPALRQAVGLPTGTSSVAAAAGSMPLPPAPDAAAAAAAAVASGAAGAIPAGVDPELRQFLLTTSDQAALFERAAALRAEGRAGATSTVLQRLLQLYPGQPNALYALGQVHGALKDWVLSEQCYLQAAQSGQLDAQSRSKAWFGAAVAMHMQQEHDAAIDAFNKAAEAAQTDELRVRSWVSLATLHRKLGDSEAAVRLLRKAARAEPQVEEAYLKPLLAELAEGRPPAEGQPLAQEAVLLEAAEQQAEQQHEEEQEAHARRQGEK